MEEQEVPAWLAELGSSQQQPEGEPPTAEGPQEQIGQADAMEDLQGPLGQVDMLEGLREQMILAEEEDEVGQRASPLQPVLEMRPAQRLVLAVLLFLNVALCGCMGLVMMGRVELPF
jgi:hypothetical protein